MSAFGDLPILPQHHVSIGARGSDGAAGAAGPAGAAGVAGAAGSFTVVQQDFDNTQLHALDTTPIVLTADVANYLQIPMYGFFEINKTHLSGAGAVPSWIVRYRGTAITAMNLGAMDLGNTRNFGSPIVASALPTNSGGVGVVPPQAGLGLETVWSASYLPSTFSGTARLTIIVALYPLRF